MTCKRPVFLILDKGQFLKKVKGIYVTLSHISRITGQEEINKNDQRKSHSSITEQENAGLYYGWGEVAPTLFTCCSFTTM
jgi:hypothetical protein